MKRTARKAISLALALSTCSSLLLANPGTQILGRTVLTALAADPVDNSFSIVKTYLKTGDTLKLKNADGMTLRYFIGSTQNPSEREQLSDVPAEGLTLTEDYYEKWIIVEATDADDNLFTDQVFFSKLPVIYLSTKDSAMPVQKADKIKGSMFLQANTETKKALYDGAMTISGRGNTTWGWDKKPYKLKLDTSTDFYGYGKSKKWVLLANYLDESLLRNTVASRLSEHLGLVSMQTEWVDLIINGEYAGNYQLCEQVGIEKGRVNIFDWEKECSNAYDAVVEEFTKDMSKSDKQAFEKQLEPLMTEDMSWMETDTVAFTFKGNDYSIKVSDYYEYSTDYSGGFLFESSEEFDEASEFLTDRKLKVMMKSPEFMLTNETMTKSAMEILQDFEDALCSPNGYNSKGQHYTELADLDSMVSYWLLMEILGNNDARYKSRYIYKPQNTDEGYSKLVFGPPWDFDTGLGSSLVTEPWDLTPDSEEWATGWKVSNYADLFNLPATLPEGVTATMDDKPEDAYGQNFYREFLDDPLFIASATEKYWQIRDYLEELIKEGGTLDTYSEYLKESGEADHARWDRSEGEFNTEWNAYARGYTEDTALFKQYLRERIAWLDEQFATDDTLLATRADQPSATPYTRSEDVTFTCKGMMPNTETAPAAAEYMADIKSGIYLEIPLTELMVYCEVYCNGVETDSEGFTYSDSTGRYQSIFISPNELYGIDGKKNVISFICKDQNGNIVGTNFCTLVQKDLSGGVSFDEETKTLTLHGTIFNTYDSYGEGDGIVLPDGVEKSDVEKIIVTSDAVLPEDSSYCFYKFKNVTEICFDNCSISNVTDISGMFCECTSLEKIDFGTGFDTSNVTDMYDMFDGCSNLQALDLSSFDTSNVEYMDYMFYKCTALQELNLSSFDTSNVTDMDDMFAYCSKLQELDLSSFDTSNVEDMEYMFYECSALQELDLSSFDTSNVEYMDYMFYGCSALKRITILEDWKTSNVKGSKDMFTGCSKLTGENGTVYSEEHTDLEYARIDREGQPGYFSIIPALAITAQPQDFIGTTNDIAEFTVAASGKNLKYQWQFLSSAGWKDSGMTGANTAALSVPITEARDGQQYRCVVSNPTGDVISNPASIHMKAVITADPTDFTGSVGETAKFTVTASGKNLKYQWQFSSSTGWKDSGMTGANTATLSVPITEARDGQQYRCVISNSAGSVTSAAASIKAKPTISAQPQNFTGSTGDTAKFTVAASGKNLKYQWQFLSSTGWQNSGMTGATTATLSVPVTEARNGQRYRCIVTAGNGTTATSAEAKIIYVSKPVITAQPTNQTGKIDSTVKFTVAASGTNLKYQWQFLSSTGWQNSGMTGAQTATLSVPVTAARDGQQYKCIITSSNGTSTTTNAVKLIAGVKITAQPKDYTGNVGTDAKFTVSAAGNNLSYQWQFNDNGVWKDSGMTGAKTATLSVPITAARNGQKYRCVVKSANGTSDTSTAATLKAIANTITGQPQNATGKVGDTVKFTVTAANATYQWQFLSTSGWQNSGMTGAQTATISVPVTEARDGQKYRCIVKFTDGTTKTSNEVSLKVQAAITAQPQNASGKVGATAKFTVTASGTNLTYQWQFLSNTGWKDSGMTGAKTATISVPITDARNGQQYRCIVTSGNGTNATSNAAKLTVTK